MTPSYAILLDGGFLRVKLGKLRARVDAAAISSFAGWFQHFHA